MSFSDEYRASYYSIHRAQHGQRALLKLEGGGVPRQSEIVEAKCFAETNVAELPVHRVGVGKRRTLALNRDAHLLFGNPQCKLQLDRAFEIRNFYQGFETIVRYLHGILPRSQVGRCELAL